MRALDVTVKGNSSGIDQMLRELNQKTAHAGEQMQKQLTGIPAGIATRFGAALGFTGVFGFINSVIEKANDIKDTSEMFDLSTDSIQKWEKALLKAGISTNTFYRSLETLRMKREEARGDEKKRGPFDDLGLLNEALGYDVSDEDLLRKILKNRSRTAINEVLGRRGATLKPASEEFDTVSATLSSEDIKRLDNIHKKKMGVWAGMQGVGSMSLMGLMGLGKMGLQGLGLMEQDSAESLVGTYTQKRANDLNERYEARENERLVKARKEREEKRKAVEENIKAQDKLLKAEADHEVKMSDLRRGSMEDEEQRAALQEEMLKTKKEIEVLQKKDALTPEEQEKLFGLQEREQSLKNSLFTMREKPASFNVTPLERAGAMFNNSVMYNPQLQVAQQQLGELREINTILRTKTFDPFGVI